MAILRLHRLSNLLGVFIAVEGLLIGMALLAWPNITQAADIQVTGYAYGPECSTGGHFVPSTINANAGDTITFYLPADSPDTAANGMEITGFPEGQFFVQNGYTYTTAPLTVGTINFVGSWRNALYCNKGSGTVTVTAVAPPALPPTPPPPSSPPPSSTSTPTPTTSPNKTTTGSGTKTTTITPTSTPTPTPTASPNPSSTVSITPVLYAVVITVVDSHGRAVVGARVSLAGKIVQTDKTGTAHFSSIAVGTYTASVSSPSGSGLHKVMVQAVPATAFTKSITTAQQFKIQLTAYHQTVSFLSYALGGGGAILLLGLIGGGLWWKKGKSSQAALAHVGGSGQAAGSTAFTPPAQSEVEANPLNSRQTATVGDGQSQATSASNIGSSVVSPNSGNPLEVKLSHLPSTVPPPETVIQPEESTVSTAKSSHESL